MKQPQSLSIHRFIRIFLLLILFGATPYVIHGAQWYDTIPKSGEYVAPKDPSKPTPQDFQNLNAATEEDEQDSVLDGQLNSVSNSAIDTAQSGSSDTSATSVTTGDSNMPWLGIILGIMAILAGGVYWYQRKNSSTVD